MSGLRPSLMKIWTCGSSPRSGSRNDWTRIKNVNGASRLSNFWNFFRHHPNDFLSRLVTMDETWLYHYDPETKQECRNPLEISRLDFFGSRRLPPHWLSSKKPHYQRGVLLISSVAIEGHVEGKNAAGRSPRRSCSCTTMSRLTGHLQARRNWLTWASNVVITLPILRIWPLRTTTFYPELKKQLKGRHFSPRRRSLLPRRPGWKDNLLKFFWVACKS